MKYTGADHAFERWVYLWGLTESGGLKSLDMLQACANVHNTSTDVVVTDHPHLSELDERLELDCVMIVVRTLVGAQAFEKWGHSRVQKLKPNDQTRWIDGCLEVQLKEAGLLLCH